MLLNVERVNSIFAIGVPTELEIYTNTAGGTEYIYVNLNSWQNSANSAIVVANKIVEGVPVPPDASNTIFIEDLDGNAAISHLIIVESGETISLWNISAAMTIQIYKATATIPPRTIFSGALPGSATILPFTSKSYFSKLLIYSSSTTINETAEVFTNGLETFNYDIDSDETLVVQMFAINTDEIEVTGSNPITMSMKVYQIDFNMPVQIGAGEIQTVRF